MRPTPGEDEIVTSLTQVKNYTLQRRVPFSSMARVVLVAAKQVCPNARYAGYKGYIDLTKYTYFTREGEFEFQTLVEPFRQVILRDGVPEGILSCKGKKVMEYLDWCRDHLNPLKLVTDEHQQVKIRFSDDEPPENDDHHVISQYWLDEDD
jgi:hypothetical protein